jgi:hypothetical protein
MRDSVPPFEVEPKWLIQLILFIPVRFYSLNSSSRSASRSIVLRRKRPFRRAASTRSSTVIEQSARTQRCGSRSSSEHPKCSGSIFRLGTISTSRSTGWVQRSPEFVRSHRCRSRCHASSQRARAVLQRLRGAGQHGRHSGAKQNDAPTTCANGLSQQR